VEETYTKNIGIVQMMRRLDVASAGEAEAIMDGAIENGALFLLCDFSETVYMSSAGIRVIISTAKRLQKIGGKLTFCCLMPAVEEVFQMTGLLSLFQVFPSRQEAIDQLSVVSLQ
jgi:anti-anti-sigma factor